jgi:hypothetical protein
MLHIWMALKESGKVGICLGVASSYCRDISKAICGTSGQIQPSKTSTELLIQHQNRNLKASNDLKHNLGCALLPSSLELSTNQTIPRAVDWIRMNQLIIFERSDPILVHFTRTNQLVHLNFFQENWMFGPNFCP